MHKFNGSIKIIERGPLIGTFTNNWSNYWWATGSWTEGPAHAVAAMAGIQIGGYVFLIHEFMTASFKYLKTWAIHQQNDDVI